MTEKIKKLKALNDEIAELVPEEELETEIMEADESLEELYSALAKVNKALAPASTETAAAGTRAEVGRPATRAEEVTLETPRTTGDETRTEPERRAEAPPYAGATPSTDRVKLPKISLLHFRGNMMKWTPFWDSFESAVHRSTHLSEIDKFNYLRSLLEGTAYDAIAGLSLSAANYTEAVEILKKRFGNKRLSPSIWRLYSE